MKKQFILRILTVVVIITAAFFMVSAARTAKVAEQEQCMQGESECTEVKSSEFLLESLTRNLLGR